MSPDQTLHHISITLKVSVYDLLLYKNNVLNVLHVHVNIKVKIMDEASVIQSEPCCDTKTPHTFWTIRLVLCVLWYNYNNYTMFFLFLDCNWPKGVDLLRIMLKYLRSSLDNPELGILKAFKSTLDFQCQLEATTL